MSYWGQKKPKEKFFQVNGPDTTVVFDLREVSCIRFDSRSNGIDIVIHGNRLNLPGSDRKAYDNMVRAWMEAKE